MHWTMAWRMLGVCDLKSILQCNTSEPLHKPDTPKIERTKDDQACSFLLFSLVKDVDEGTLKTLLP
jgi:hypothetical protein